MIFFIENIIKLIFLYLIVKIECVEETNLKYLLKLHGNTHYLNYYYTTLFFNSEKESQTFLLDTTSSITTAPCNLCQSCGDHVNDFYTFKHNLPQYNTMSKQCNTLSNILSEESDVYKCNFTSDFQNEGKINGIYINNQIFFDNINNEKEIKNDLILPVGCTLKETGRFQSSIADGILGLANNEKSFVSVMYSKNYIRNNLFTLCFSDEGGYFSIGEIDRKYYLENIIRYVNLLTDENLYKIHILGLKIGNNNINENYRAIIDTSSTISYFPKSLVHMIMKGFSEECAEKNNECGEIKWVEGYGICAEFKNEKEKKNAIKYAWPLIKIQLFEFEYIWEPSNYYMDYSPNNRTRACVGIENINNNNNENNKDKNEIILGTNFLRGYDVIFEIDNKRMGFAKAVCSRNISEKMSILNASKIEEERKKNEENKKIEEIKNIEQIIKEDDQIHNQTDEPKEQIEDIQKNQIEDFSYNYFHRIIFMTFFILLMILIYVAFSITNMGNNNNKQMDTNSLLTKNKEKDINKEESPSNANIIEMVEEKK